jgi:hypothetical protein
LIVSTAQSSDEIKSKLKSLDANSIFAIDGVIHHFLSTQSEEGQEFLLRTAILEKFCPPFVIGSVLIRTILKKIQYLKIF